MDRNQGANSFSPRRFGRDAPKPVSVGEQVEVTIESEGSHGDGIAKKDGFVLFIKGAKKGETCNVKVAEVKRTYATADKV